MHLLRRICTDALAATALIAAPAAGATLTGTVIGRPAVHGATAVVPVLLREHSRTAAHLSSPLAKLHVPASRIRRADGIALSTDNLRVGDSVTAQATQALHSSRLLVTHRGTAPSFGSIDATLKTAGDDARTAANEAATLQQQTSDVTGQANLSTAQLRTELLAVRTDVNLLISSLRDTSTGLAGAVSAIAAARPADPARRDAVTKAQTPYLTPLSDIATSDSSAAGQLDTAVAQLDTTINQVGGGSNPSLPIQTTATASDVLTAIVQIVSAVRVPGLPSS